MEITQAQSDALLRHRVEVGQSRTHPDGLIEVFGQLPRFLIDVDGTYIPRAFDIPRRGQYLGRRGRFYFYRKPNGEVVAR